MPCQSGKRKSFIEIVNIIKMRNLELNLIELSEKEHLELSGGFNQNSVEYTKNVEYGLRDLAETTWGFFNGLLGF